MLLTWLARLPPTAMGVTLTLHVVTDLGRGYGAAGLVGTATMLGSALGAPLIGRLIDRYGLRPVLALCGVASTAFWIGAPWLPYPVLVTIALPAGMLVVPVGSISRQVLTTLVPPEQRRSAYSLESVLTEASFMVGPAAGIAISTQFSGTAALLAIGAGFAVGSFLLYWHNPPIRTRTEAVTGERPAMREWLTRPLAATLCTATGALFCLAGTELATLAALRATGDVSWTGPVIVAMCVASAVGGIVHGAVRRSLSLTPLLILLTLLVIPAGLFAQPWWLLAIALIPTNVACAPTLASITEEVGRLAPARVRGEAMGLLDSSTRLGLALGSPVVGFAIDHASAAWGFAAAGIGGLGIASAGLALRLRMGLAKPVPAP
ncbi:MFS transporter [Amycolatopsis acidicola]|uniref:MFS transporter n=1 Tax=Amycolatopsis acidicola TaxID=2596893 RepID=A0A5N0URD9_9PSEU|nr:MFS transporter [Amycolatopsis acidicola]